MTDNILTPNQLAEKLSVSKSWIYKKVVSRILPHFRIGGLVRFSEKEINEWLGKHHVEGRMKV